MNGYQAERCDVLQTRTSGHEAWLDDATLELLVLAREGLAVRLPMTCQHREWFTVASPAVMRQYASQKCTRCLLFDLTRTKG